MRTPRPDGQQIIRNAISPTDRLHEIIRTKADWRKGVLSTYHGIVMRPLADAKIGDLPRGDAFKRLQACASLIESELAKVCGRQDVDVWLAYVRRLPAITNWEADWVVCATLAIMKYAQWSAPTTAGTVQLPEMAVLRVPWSPKVAEDAVRIALLSRHIAVISSDCRWIGKGAVIEHRGNGRYGLRIPQDVEQAVNLYAQRRPNTPPWHELGIVPVPPLKDGGELVIDGLGDLHAEVKVSGLGLSTPTAYFPLFQSTSSIAYMLEPYGKPLEEQYGVTMAVIMHNITAITRSITRRLPAFVEGTRFTFDQDPSNARFAGSLSFFLSVVQRGLVMMPEATLRTNLSAEVCPPWSNNGTEAAEHVEAFFRVFALNLARRHEIDVVYRLPFYRLLFTSPGGTCYIDLLAVAEFYRELVLGARMWAGKLHGDHFAMDVRRLCKRISGVTALPKITGLRYPSGQEGEIDVPLLIGRRLYVVECKAYRKSTMLMAGDPAEMNNRTQEIKSWVQQAQRVADTLRSQRTNVTPQVPEEVNEIEWVVCTAAQEYVCPAIKFGSVGALLRVCTVEELIEHLQAEAAAITG